MFSNFESQLLLAQEKGVDTSVYYSELEEIRIYILSLKEPEIKVDIEEDIDENQDENIDFSTDETLNNSEITD